MYRQRNGIAITLAILCITSLALSGCASTRARGADADATPPAKADVRNQVGDNGLPTPAALQARYVDALGGEKALRQHESSTRKGKMTIAAMGMEGSTTTHAAAPDKIVMNIETGMGAMNQGYNGQVGWSDNPMTGAQVLDGDQLANMKQQADYYMPLNYAKHFTTQETVEETEWGGEAAYKVRLVNSTGREAFHYFGKDSAMLLGLQAVQDGPMGESEVKITFSEYKDFGGGMKIPAKTTLDVAGMQIEQTVETVTFDAVDPAAFEPPEAVKAQLK